MVYLRVRSNDRPIRIADPRALSAAVVDRVAIARAVEMCSVSELTNVLLEYSSLLRKKKIKKISRDKEGWRMLVDRR